MGPSVLRENIIELFHFLFTQPIFISLLVSFLIPVLLIVAMFFFFRANAVYRIAKRRELGNPWLAYIPIAQYYLIGEIADQQILAEGKKDRFYRRWMIILDFILLVLDIAQLVFVIPNILIRLIAIVILVFNALAFDAIYRSQTTKGHTALLVFTILVGTRFSDLALFINRDRDDGVPSLQTLPELPEENMNTI